MSQAQPSYMFYRQSTIGTALTDALDDMIQEGSIDPQVAMHMLSQFDASVAEALRLQVRAKTTVKGKLHIYRFCDDVWTFVIEGATFKFENSETVRSENKVKLVACAAPKAS
ncbi:transcription initiation factor IIA, gamma subunit, helical domain-containing protein [Chytriomyces sp. MP71]|nr:transcription initiation factor IIA, gamma subunit, helical domain-containing protein [Chytriomyces sp. MP71]